MISRRGLLAGLVGERSGPGGARRREPNPASIPTRVDLWVADHREGPEVPCARTDRRRKLRQYLADSSESNAAYGPVSRAIPRVTHCGRKPLARETVELYRYCGVGRVRA